MHKHVSAEYAGRRTSASTASTEAATAVTSFGRPFLARVAAHSKQTSSRLAAVEARTAHRPEQNNREQSRHCHAQDSHTRAVHAGVVSPAAQMPMHVRRRYTERIPALQKTPLQTQQVPMHAEQRLPFLHPLTERAQAGPGASSLVIF